MNIKESGEMYLETIYLLSQTLDNVRSLDVANEMGFSKPSVSRAIHLLENDGLLIIDNNGYLFLTEEGAKMACDIYERHIVLTKLLENFGVPKEIAENDACKMEHIISDISFEAIKKALMK